MKLQKRSPSEMKDSGVEWIGEIPKNWSVRKLKQFSRNKVMKQEKSEFHLDLENIESKTGRLINSNEDSMAAEESEETSQCIQFNENNVLFGKLRPYLCKYYLCDKSGTCSSELLVIEADSISSAYLFSLIQTDAFSQYSVATSYGVKMPRTSWKYVREFLAPVSIEGEQSLIGDFIVNLNTTINATRSVKQKQIELLREHEKSLIHHAVTKGLDPKATLKDSGVAWIGEIPQHYKLTKLKMIGKYLNGLPFKPSDWKDEGVPIIRIQNLTDETKQFNYYSGEFDGEYGINDGDLLVSWSATIGVFRWNRGPAVLNQHIFKVEVNSEIDDQFYFYLVDDAIKEMVSKMHGSAMTHIIDKHFRNFKVSIPQDKKEQEIIARVLDSETSRIQNAIRNIELEIEKLEEYRKSLIYEVVTGKVKVVS